jgi:hypothetical protein
MNGIDEKGQMLCTRMPRFANRLDENSAQEVVNFLRTLPAVNKAIPETLFCPPPPVTPEPQPDGGADVRDDVPSTDGGVDAAPDITPDAAPDTTPDAGPDTAPDGGADDASPDAAPDVQIDAGVDAAADVDIDAGG